MNIEHIFHKHYWNVFSHLNETIDNSFTKKPHARTLKSSIEQKYMDAVFALSGQSHEWVEIKGRKITLKQAKSGLIDYLLFQLPIVVKLCKELLREFEIWFLANVKHEVLFGILMSLIAIPFFSAQIVTSVLEYTFIAVKEAGSLVLASLFIPLIAVVQAITYALVHSDWENLKKELDIGDNQLYAFNDQRSDTTKVSMEDNVVTVKIFTDAEDTYQYTFSSIESAKASQLYFFNIAHASEKIDELNFSENRVGLG